jgi:glycosyltransferase involved in cell wall biosynthesis
MVMKIVYSSELQADIITQIGLKHYSYVFVENRIVSALARRGHELERVDAPEMFKSRIAFADLLRAQPSEIVHIAFRATENLRILSGAWNIGHFAWEFEVLRDRNLITEAVTSNQIHMLNLLDEIWVSCNFTRDVALRHGLRNVHIVPPPVCGAALPQRKTFEESASKLAETPCIPLVASTGLAREWNAIMATERLSAFSSLKAIERRRAAGDGRVFLTVCNPHDRRKNLMGLIEGFRYAAGAEDILLLKISVPNKGNFRAISIYDGLIELFGGPGSVIDGRTIVIADYLDDEQMGALYSISDFYLCASHCEGFNLPLVEAMSYGTVPITTNNTAMLDYIDENNAIIIDERRFPAPVVGLTADVSGTIYDISIASRFDIARAIRKAGALDSATLKALSGAARSAILSRYSEASLVPLMEKRMSAALDRRKTLAHAE